MPRKAYDSRED